MRIGEIPIYVIQPARGMYPIQMTAVYMHKNRMAIIYIS